MSHPSVSLLRRITPNYTVATFELVVEEDEDEEEDDDAVEEEEETREGNIC